MKISKIKKITTSAIITIVGITSFGNGVFASDFSKIDYLKVGSAQELCEMVEGAEFDNEICITRIDNINDLKSLKLKIKGRIINGDKIYKAVEKTFGKKYIGKSKITELKGKASLYYKINNKIDTILKKNISKKKKELYGMLYLVLAYGLEQNEQKLNELSVTGYNYKTINKNNYNLGVSSYEKIKQDEASRAQSGIKLNSQNQTFNHEGTSQSNTNIGTERGKQLLQEKFFSGPKAEVQWRSLAFDPANEIDSLTTSYKQHINGKHSRMTASLNSKTLLKEVKIKAAMSYNTYMSCILDGKAVYETDANAHTSLDGYSLHDRIVYAIDKLPESDIDRQSFIYTGYSTENGKLVYNEEDNMFKKDAKGKKVGYVNLDTLEFTVVK